MGRFLARRSVSFLRKDHASRFRLAGFAVLPLSLLCVFLASAPTAGAQPNAALTGVHSMSVYVNVDGSSDINAATLRLNIEDDLRRVGVNVLPHASPPNFPVMLLTIAVHASTHAEVITQYDPTKPVGLRNQQKTITVTTLPYELSVEMRRLAPNTTTATRPIRDEAFWRRTASGEVPQIQGVAIGDRGLSLAYDFVHQWAAANPGRRATVFHPAPPMIPDEVGDTVGPLYRETIQVMFLGAIDSIYDVPESIRSDVRQQFNALVAAGQKVATCEYRSRDPNSTATKDYDFWYKAPPANVMALLVTPSSPFLRLGRNSVNGCPKTVEAAEGIYQARLN
jgi:hypothetical protein